jgi:flagella basal body P-ring formation protein FlgA
MTLRGFLALVFSTIAFTAYAGEPQMTEIIVPAHEIARGAVIVESDLAVQSVPMGSVSDSAVRDFAAVTGQEARRTLRAGEPLRATDVKHPTLVAKGATVTMVFDAPGIQLSATGRALGDGGIGDAVTVVNPVSYRQIQATVIAPGTVRVGTAPTTIASR